MGRATGRGNKELGALQLLKGLVGTLGSAGRGVAAGTLGLPGDLESLVRVFTGGENALPTSDRLLETLPQAPGTRQPALEQIGTYAALDPRPAGKLVKGALTTTRDAIKHGAEQFAHASAAANPRIVKDKGGNWLRTEGTEYLNDLLQYPRGRNPNNREAEQAAFELANPKAKAINDWVRGALTKYVKSDLGAASDPLLKLAGEGISPLPKEALLSAPESWITRNAARNRKFSGLEQPELGGYQQGWSDLADAMVMPVEKGGLRTGFGNDWRTVGKNMDWNVDTSVDNDYFKEMVQNEGEWLGKLPDDAKVYQFHGDEAPYHLGLDRTVDALNRGFNTPDLPDHLVLTPEKLKQMGVEKAVRYQNELDNWLKYADEQEMLEVGRSPIYAGTKLKEFDDGSYITELSLPKELTEDMRKLVRQNEDGTWTAITPSGKPMKRRVVPGEKAPLVDVVEPTPERAILGGMLGHEGRVMNHCVGGYCDEVSRGGTRILSYRGPDNKPHVTLDIEQGIPAELRDRAGQAQREYNRYYIEMVDDSLEDDALDFPTWLEENYPDLLEHGPELFENGASSPIVRQVYGAANSTPKPEYQAPVGSYLKEAQLYGDTDVMLNAGLYPYDEGFITKQELKNLIEQGDIQAMDVSKHYSPYDFKEGGLVEADDDFGYPGVF
jgi:hypothetical protein